MKCVNNAWTKPKATMCYWECHTADALAHQGLKNILSLVKVYHLTKTLMNISYLCMRLSSLIMLPIYSLSLCKGGLIVIKNVHVVSCSFVNFSRMKLSMLKSGLLLLPLIFFGICENKETKCDSEGHKNFYSIHNYVPILYGCTRKLYKQIDDII